MSLYFTIGRPFLLKVAPSHGVSGPVTNTCYPGPTRVLNTNGISIRSSVFVGLTSVTDRPTDRQTDQWVWLVDVFHWLWSFTGCGVCCCCYVQKEVTIIIGLRWWSRWTTKTLSWEKPVRPSVSPSVRLFVCPSICLSLCFSVLFICSFVIE